MLRSAALVVVCSTLAGVLMAEDAGIQLPLVDEINGTPVPASPADPEHHTGHRLYRLPTFTHWPAIVYRDERRNAAFHLPVPEKNPTYPKHLPRPIGEPKDPRAKVGWGTGDTGTIGWLDQPAQAITLPTDPLVRRTSGLLDLTMKPGHHKAQVAIGSDSYLMPLRIVDHDQPWPHAGLADGFPVDADGVPVVLRDVRIDPASRRTWAAFRKEGVRPTGPVWIVGDPLAAPDGDVFADLASDDVVVKRATDQRYPHNAALVALAGFDQLDQLPRTIVYSPGNAALHAGVWTAEATRLLDLVRNRVEALGQAPRLVLLLPPLPVDLPLQEEARRRRTVLKQRAAYTGWEVADAVEWLAGIAEPNRFAEGLYTRHPTKDGLIRLRERLRALIAE